MSKINDLCGYKLGVQLRNKLNKWFKWRRMGSNEVWCNYLSDCEEEGVQMKCGVII